jgi:conjugal transfer mating pair stabilization protein TraG
MSSEQLSEFRQFGERVSRDRSLVELIGSDSREGRELASRLATTTAQAEKAESSYTERRQRAERLSSAHERGESISIDIAQDPHNLAMFLRYAEAYGGSSASAQALMDAELARRGLPPNRQGLEGAALPSSFEEWRAGAGRSGPASEAGGGVERARVSNDAEVVGRSHAAVSTGLIWKPSAAARRLRRRRCAGAAALRSAAGPGRRRPRRG